MNDGEGRRGTEIAKDNYNLKNCTVFKQPKNQKKYCECFTVSTTVRSLIESIF